MLPDYVLAVTGGRKRIDAEPVLRVLDEHVRAAAYDSLLVVQGGCPTGVDYQVREWAQARGVPCVSMLAAWKCFGPAAGPRRNRWMMELLQPDLLIAFPGGAGTEDCITKAQDAFVRIQRYDAAGTLVE